MHTDFAIQSPQPLSQDHVREGINWLADMAETGKWDLNAAEIADLLGGISLRQYQYVRARAAKGLAVNLSRDCIERISLLLGIWQSLQNIVPSGHSDLAYKWFNQANTSHVLMGKSIKHYLLDRKNMEALYVVRRYLQAQNV